MLGYYPTSGDADTAIRRWKGHAEGRKSEDGAKNTLDKVTLTIE